MKKEWFITININITVLIVDIKSLIPPEQTSKLCRYCNHLVFKTKEEYDDYYKKQEFKQQMRRVMEKNASIEGITRI